MSVFGNLFGSSGGLSQAGIDFLGSEAGNASFHSLSEAGKEAMLKGFGTEGGLGSLGGIMQSQGFSNLTGAMGAGSGLFSAWAGYSNAKKSLKEQKRANRILERQLGIENARYDTEMKKHDDANAQIAKSAESSSLFERA